MAAPPGIIRLHVETAQTDLLPIGPPPLHAHHILHAPDLAQQHHGGEILEPVGAEGAQGHGHDHGVGVPLFDLEVELRAEVVEQTGGHVTGVGEGDQGGDGDAVAEGDLAGDDGRGDLGVGRGWVRGCARGAVDDWRGWIF